MSDDGSCDAKVPVITGDIIQMVICGTVPAPHAFEYGCEHGHRRTGRTCDVHAHASDNLPGCVRCFTELNHECPMQWRSL